MVELAAAAGFAFVVVDLEHSTLTERDAVGLVRHADLCGLPALVRVPEVDAAAVNRLLEAGAVGVQLSMLTRVAQTEALVAATRFAPALPPVGEPGQQGRPVRRGATRRVPA